MVWDNKKIIYTPRRTPPQKNRWFLVFSFGMVFILIGLGYGAYIFLMQKKFIVGDALITGNTSVSSDKVQEIINEYLNQKVMLVFPRREYFFISSRDAAQYLEAKIPEIKRVTVTKALPNTLTVTIEERTIWGVVCNRGVNAVIGTSTEYADIPSAECAYVDDSAFAFKTAPFFASGSLTKKIFTDQLPIEIGTEPISKKIILLYNAVQAVLTDLSIPMTSLVLSENTPRDIRVYSGNWYILIDPEVHVENFKTVLGELAEKTLKNKFDQVEYIDLRFGNKIFLKKK